MIIQTTNNEVLIKLSNKVKLADLQVITDWFQYLEITAKSKAKQQDIDKLVAEVKKGRWAKTKKQLGL